MIRKLISGGQSGVDRAALDVALEGGLPCGGWCPAGKWAEDGALDLRYPLTETPQADPAQRTRWNVRDSGGTLVLAPKDGLIGGTAQTVQAAAQWGRPCLIVDPAELDRVKEVREWLHRHRIAVLNVAGPRQSERPGIYEQARRFLRQYLGLGTPSGPIPDSRKEANG